jgi:hypothetical protein
MSLVSLFALGIYSYVLWLCRRAHRRAGHDERRRLKLASLAFALDLSVSAFFSAATPAILKKGGVPFDRKNLPRPIFWFFAVTGFVPTASMCLTVLGGWRWHKLIKDNPTARRWHIIIGWVAYLSWWVACSPLFVMGVLGEKRTVELLKKSKWLQ